MVRGHGDYQLRLRERNWDLVYDTLVRKGPRTFTELCRDTRLSTRTIAKILKAMVEEQPESVLRFKGLKVGGRVQPTGGLPDNAAYSIASAGQGRASYLQFANSIEHFKLTRGKESLPRFVRRALQGNPTNRDMKEHHIEKRPRKRVYYAAAVLWPYKRWQQLGRFPHESL